jgi:hypothetical protein
MPRTPDRFPGERQDEGLLLFDNAAAGDPTDSGGVRFITDRFRFRDDLGVYTGRPVYSTTANPTTSDDNSSGFNVGMLWINTTSGASFICQDDTNSAAVWVHLNRKRDVAHFALAEDVFNTPVYFHAERGAGGDAPGNKRSGANAGVQNPNSSSPWQVPFDATITGAVLSVRGVGVQNGSVTYPVTYQTDLYLQDWTNDTTKLGDIDFSISNSFTVGTYSVGATNFTGSTSLSIDVDEGQLLGLEFINGTGASLAGQTRNAFVDLILEERL